MVVSSSISGAGFSILTLQHRARLMNARIEAGEQAVTRSNFVPQADGEPHSASEWAELRPSINAAADRLDILIGRTEAIRDTVSTLLSINANAASADADALEQYVKLFNYSASSLNSLANSTSQIPNLIGTDYDVDIAYFSNPDLDVASITHRDLSSGYIITESGGKYWTKDDTSTDVTLLQYDSSGVETGKSAIINQELRLDSLSGSNISFTIHTGTASEESFTGATLSTNGLGILDAWAYEGLATSDGRASAESDLRAALKTLDSNLASLNGALTQAKFDSGIAEVKARGSANKLSDLNQRQLLALQELTTKSTNTDLALASAISRNSVLRNGYLTLLGGGSQGNIVDIST